MKRMTMFAVALAVAACGNKSETAPPPLPVPVTAGSAAPTPVGPTATNRSEVTDNDKTLVVNAAQIDAADMTFNAPSGERVPVAVAKRGDGTWKVDVTVGGKPFETIDTGLAITKEAARSIPIASVVRIQNTVVVVAGTRSTSEPPTSHFDARVLAWDGKALVLSKRIVFDHVPTPAAEVIDTHENAGRP
ncbi:MAG: hypothetical protein NT062_15670 [Proteobacteria bacterium]|nr:hypothetical protein [Pseudomonadota bacterium]